MLANREGQKVGPQQATGRRSFSHNLRSSFDSASSRLSFSGKISQPQRRSISGPRIIQAIGGDGSGDTEPDSTASLVPESFSTYSLSQPRRNSASEYAVESVSTSVKDEPPIDAAPELQRIQTSESSTRMADRPGSAFSSREDSFSSISSTNAKWYKRFHRNSSAQRLSKAAETAEIAFSQSTTRLSNPFTRRRSIPVLPKVSTTILGQSTGAAIAIGGYASNASKTLPAERFPFSSIEVPYIMDACVSWLIENHAQMTPGIFRVNGSTQAVKTIIQHFSAGCIRMPLEHIELPGKQMISVHDVASCLKKFLVLLPEGLLGVSVFEQLSAIAEKTQAPESTMTPHDIALILLDITDKWKYNMVLILIAFLDYIARQTAILAAEDDPKQESGFMTPFSLGIVFSPCCLGSTSGPIEMRRSSTSYSDRSVQSDITPIEEAVAVARKGAKVMQMLISQWQATSKLLAEQSLDASAQDDNVSVLNIQPRSEPTETARHGLKTILDSPIKGRDSTSGTHARTESIDTIVMHRKSLLDDSKAMLMEARVDILQAKVNQLELERDDVSQNLRIQQAENAKLFSRNLELEREIRLLRNSA